MKTLPEIFPRASKSFLEANPLPLPSQTTKQAKNGILGAANGKRRGRMNATETEYALILESMKGKGEILRYEYEGITLRWLIGDKIIQYTPDFYVLRSPSMLLDGDKPWAPLFIEVKGAFTGGKFERAVERHRHARTRWPEFAFELHQKKRGQWTRLM